MLDLVLAAAKLQSDLDGLDLPNCIIGGLALQAWGEPRLTRDVDYTVLTRFIDEEEKLREMLTVVSPRRADALQFALRNRVLLGLIDGSVPVDLGMGAFEYEERIVERARTIEVAPATWLRVCSPEDLVVMKTFAGRDQDWIDIAGIISRQPTLKWDQIESDLVGLLEVIEAPERLERLLALCSAR